ncbi:hypothetical protein A6M13_13680 [Caryophanon tenue]|uniref:SbsA Ig-like domain-containing protein n=1 Tax=Caryophanon tenue TaxID=33978 RepID=A0A1C0YDE6_9BACL|nr:hypothetical protein A6M13_13680 [Caryophanon tenue]
MPTFADRLSPDWNLKNSNNIEADIVRTLQQTDSAKKVLFINNKSAHNSIENEYRNLNQHLLDNGFDVNQISGTSLTNRELRKHDIIIITTSSFTNFTTATLENFQNYVAEGGSLFILGNLFVEGDYENVIKLNALTTVFGIEFLKGIVIDGSQYAENFAENFAAPVINDFKEHPITNGVTDTWLGYGTALNVSPPALSLATSSSASYLETRSSWSVWEGRWRYEKDNYDLAGPLAILASSEFGKGRVVVFGDEDIFNNNHYYNRDPSQLLNNILSWMSAVHIDRSIHIEPVYPAETLASSVMKGGSAIRIYKLQNSDGELLKNLQVDYEINGIKKTVQSNDKGEIQIITPPLTNMSATKIDIIFDQNNIDTISFPIEMRDRSFEQEWMGLLAIEGGLGAGVGGNIQIGNDTGLQAGASAGFILGAESYFSMKYLVNANKYDLLLELGQSFKAGVNTFAGLQTEIDKTLSFDLLSGNLNGNIQNTIGTNLVFSEFNDTNKHTLENALYFYYQLLSSALLQAPQLRENLVIVTMLNKIETLLEEHTSYKIKTFYQNRLDWQAGANLLALQTNLAGLNVNAAALQNAAHSSSLLKTTFDSPTEKTVLSQFSSSIDKSALTVVGGYSKDVNHDIASNLNIAGELDTVGESNVIEAEEEMLYKKDKLTGYSYAYFSELDLNGALLKDIESESITKKKYIMEEDAIEQTQALTAIQKAQQQQIDLFFTPMDKLDQFLSETTTPIRYEESKIVKNDFELPVSVGVGLGLKIDLGFNLAGSSSVEYISEEGVFSPNQGTKLTAVYTYDDVIENQQHDITSALNVLGDILVGEMKDLFKNSVELAENVRGFVNEAVTTAYTEIKDNTLETTKRIKVELSKMLPESLRSFKSEEGDVIILSDVFFLTFTDEHNQTISNLGDTTVPLTINYTDEALTGAGLTNAEENLAIYRWDEEKVIYVKVPNAQVNLQENSVTIETSLAGQYILAYNELTPKLSDVTITQDDAQLKVNGILKDKFEAIDPDEITFLTQFSYKSASSTTKTLPRYYNPRTGEFELIFNYLEPGMLLFNSEIFVGDKHIDTINHEILFENPIINEYESQIHIGNYETFFKFAFYNSKYPVNNAKLIYTIDNGTEQEIDLEKNNNYWMLKMESVEPIDFIRYKIVYETAFGHKKETQEKIKYSSDYLPLEVVDHANELQSKEPIILTFNQALSEQSNLESITLQDEHGNTIDSTISIQQNKLVIEPLLNISGQATIYIPRDSIKLARVPSRANTQSFFVDTNIVNPNKLTGEFEKLPKHYKSLSESSSLTVTFSDAVQASLTENLPYLVDEDGNTIATNITASEDRRQLMITPVDDYRLSTEYVLYVDEQLRNYSGTQTLKQAEQYRFIPE